MLRRKHRAAQQEVPMIRLFFGSPELGYLSHDDVTAEVDRSEIYFSGREKSRDKQRIRFIDNTYRAAEQTLGIVSRPQNGIYVGTYVDDRRPPIAHVECELAREADGGAKLLCLDALAHISRILPAEYPLPYRELPKHDLTSRILLTIMSQRQH